MNASPDAGRSVTVMGLGLFGGGLACARWYAARGARVTITDLRDERELAPTLAELGDLPVRLVLGRHETLDFERADVVVANPAVPPSSPFLAAARAKGARITSELALALRACRARVALITGTQGKSSTAHFVARLLRGAGLDAELCGNVGRPLLDHVGSLDAESLAIVEVSSYQLELMALEVPALEPLADGVCITNVLGDHLERHGDLESYARAKASILRYARPGGFALIDPRDERLVRALPSAVRAITFDPSAPGASPIVELERGADGDGGAGHERELEPTGVRASRRDDGRLAIVDGLARLDGEPLGRVDQAALPGAFQRENIARALGFARALGAPAERLRAAVESLRGLPHRLEPLGRFAGCEVIDNGVSTTPDSTLSAVRAWPALGAGDLVWIGGRRKRGLGFDELGRELARRGIEAIVFGADRDSIADELEGAGARCVRTPDLDGALAHFDERRPARALFSPAAASFDSDANFRARALRFRASLAKRASDAPDVHSTPRSAHDAAAALDAAATHDPVAAHDPSKGASRAEPPPTDR